MNPSAAPSASQENPSDDDQPLAESARAAFQDIKSGLRDAASSARSSASQIPDRQRQRVADRLHEAGDAVHASAKKAESEDPNVAWLTHSVADRIDQASDYLRATDFHTMRSDAENFARRNPAIFMGGLLVTGLLVGSFLKVTASAATSSKSGSSSRRRGPGSNRGSGEDNRERNDDVPSSAPRSSSGGEGAGDGNMGAPGMNTGIPA